MVLISKIKGFALLELLIAITLLTTAIAISVSYVNVSGIIEKKTALKLDADFKAIERAIENYKDATGNYTAGEGELNDINFPELIPSFLFPPRACKNFTNYSYKNDNNTKVYIYTSTNVESKNTASYKAMRDFKNKSPMYKVYINTFAGAISSINESSLSFPAVLYVTYWVKIT
jgi:type II secretory pathway pseudopilin PulG